MQIYIYNYFFNVTGIRRFYSKIGYMIFFTKLTFVLFNANSLPIFVFLSRKMDVGTVQLQRNFNGCFEGISKI